MEGRRNVEGKKSGRREGEEEDEPKQAREGVMVIDQEVMEGDCERWVDVGRR
jgi:hypothetical protein